MWIRAPIDIVEVGGTARAIIAARYCRTLRTLGVTIRSSIDRLIATFCIQQGARLLHQDRVAFLPMQQPLGLACL